MASPAKSVTPTCVVCLRPVSDDNQNALRLNAGGGARRLPPNAPVHVGCFKCHQCKHALLRTEQLHFIRVATNDAIRFFCRQHRPRNSFTAVLDARAPTGETLKHLTKERPKANSLRRLPNWMTLRKNRTQRGQDKEENTLVEGDEAVASTPETSSNADAAVNGTVDTTADSKTIVQDTVESVSNATRSAPSTTPAATSAAAKSASMSTTTTPAKQAAAKPDAQLEKLFRDAGISDARVATYMQYCTAKRLRLADFLHFTKSDLQDMGMLKAHQLNVLHCMRTYTKKLNKRLKKEKSERKRAEKAAKQRQKKLEKLQKTKTDPRLCDLCEKPKASLREMLKHRRKRHPSAPPYDEATLASKTSLKRAAALAEHGDAGESSKPKLPPKDDEHMVSEHSDGEAVRGDEAERRPHDGAHGGNDDDDDEEVSSYYDESYFEYEYEHESSAQNSAHQWVSELTDDEEDAYAPPLDGYCEAHRDEVRKAEYTMTLMKATQWLQETLGESADTAEPNVVIFFIPCRLRVSAPRTARGKAGLVVSPTLAEKEGMLFATKLALHFRSHDQSSEQRLQCSFNYDDIRDLLPLHRHRIYLQPERRDALPAAVLSAVPERNETFDILLALWSNRREEEALRRYKLSAVQAEIEFAQAAEELAMEAAAGEREANDTLAAGAAIDEQLDERDADADEQTTVAQTDETDALMSTRLIPLKGGDEASADLRAMLDAYRDVFGVDESERLFMLTECHARLYETGASGKLRSCPEQLRGVLFISETQLCVREVRHGDAGELRMVAMPWRDVAKVERRTVQSFAGILESYALDVIGRPAARRDVTADEGAPPRANARLRPPRLTITKVSSNLDDIQHMLEALVAASARHVGAFGTSLPGLLEHDRRVLDEARRRESNGAAIDVVTPRLIAEQRNRRVAAMCPTREGDTVADNANLSARVLDDVPIVLRALAACVCTSLQEEGLFRVSASRSEQERARLALEAGYWPRLQSTSVHVSCGLLKEFFRALPQPLMTYDAHQCFLAVPVDDAVVHKSKAKRGLGGNAALSDAQLLPLLGALRLLPRVHRNTLRYLCAFLLTVAAHKDRNRMGRHNLATIFGAILFRERRSSLFAHADERGDAAKDGSAATDVDPLASMKAAAEATQSAFKENAKLCNVVLILLDHFEAVFDALDAEPELLVDESLSTPVLPSSSAKRDGAAVDVNAGDANDATAYNRRQSVVADSFVIGYRVDCAHCGNDVPPPDRLLVDSAIYHRVCFVCANCGVSLHGAEYERDATTAAYLCAQCSSS